jgi:hypothetical protein
MKLVAGEGFASDLRIMVEAAVRTHLPDIAYIMRIGLSGE